MEAPKTAVSEGKGVSCVEGSALGLASDGLGKAELSAARMSDPGGAGAVIFEIR